MIRRMLSMIGLIPNSKGSVSLSHLCARCGGTLSQLADGSSKFLLGQNSNEKLRSFVNRVGVKMNLITFLFSQQCNRVAALRLRRAYQILLLYQRIYGKQLLMQKIMLHLRLYKNRPLMALFSAAIFQWENERVTDDELKKCTEDIEEVHKLVELSHKPNLEDIKLQEASDWEQVVDRADFKIWRRLIPQTNLYQYRVFGHFTDIPARAFYNTQLLVTVVVIIGVGGAGVLYHKHSTQTGLEEPEVTCFKQVDVEYWKVWDKNTMEVRVVDKDNETESAVLHWKYKFPYPMYPRDYVYVRRCKVDSDSNTMIITARATEHPSCPEEDACVRVATYCSQMVIRPYTTFEENGFDYLMTYLDDPKTNFPPMCYNWLASTGVHEFLEKVHKAAKKKHERATESSTTRIDNSSETLYPKIIHH